MLDIEAIRRKQYESKDLYIRLSAIAEIAIETVDAHSHHKQVTSRFTSALETELRSRYNDNLRVMLDRGGHGIFASVTIKVWDSKLGTYDGYAHVPLDESIEDQWARIRADFGNRRIHDGGYDEKPYNDLIKEIANLDRATTYYNNEIVPRLKVLKGCDLGREVQYAIKADIKDILGGSWK